MSFVNAVAKGTTLNDIYPIGSVIIKNAPWAGFAGQTWELFSQGKTLVGQDTNDADFTTVGQIGGSKTKQLSLNEIPSHRHGLPTYLPNGPDINVITGWSNIDDGNVRYDLLQSEYQGGGQAFNIMNPYQVVLYYRRTA